MGGAATARTDPSTSARPVDHNRPPAFTHEGLEIAEDRPIRAGARIAALVVYPALHAIYLSMLNKRMTAFVGLDNFAFLFRRDTFKLVIFQSTLFAVSSVLLKALMGFTLAHLMHNIPSRAQRIWRGLSAGLAAVGILGILDRAAREGMVDLEAAFTRLKATNPAIHRHYSRPCSLPGKGIAAYERAQWAPSGKHFRWA